MSDLVPSVDTDKCLNQLSTPLRSVVLAVAALCGLAQPCLAQPTWTVSQLTNDGNLNLAPDVSGNTIVWQSGLQGVNDILMWTEGDNTPTVISQWERCSRPRMSDGRVVFFGRPSTNVATNEIRLWDNGVLTTLTSNDEDDRNPSISGPIIAWQARFSIVYDDGVEQTEVVGISGSDMYPSVGGDLLVWEASSGNQAQNEIYLWQDGVQQQLTSNGYFDIRPETDGTTIVWYAASGQGGTNEIWRWTSEQGAVELTGNAVNDVQPDVSGDVIVFARFDGNDHEIVFNYLGVDYQVTDNDYDDLEPAIDGNRIVWEGRAQSGRQVFYAVIDGLTGGETAGACCLGIDCVSVTPTECETLTGVFNGPETMCDEDACGSEAAGGWSTYQHDAQRSGRTDAIVPDEPIRLWSLLVGPQAWYRSAPSVGPDGTIYSNDVAVSPNGDLLWVHVVGGSTPAIRRDGNFFQTRLGLEKVDHTTGDAFCSAATGSNYPSALSPAGIAYANPGSGNGPWSVEKVSPACDVLWTYDGENGVRSHVALGLDGGIHVSARFHYVKIDPETGIEAWRHDVPLEPVGEPAVGPGGTIYRSVPPNKIVANNPDGTERWTHTFADPNLRTVAPSPAIAADGTLYVPTTYEPSDFAALIALSPDGNELWTRYENAGGMPFSPVVDGAGKILWPLVGGKIKALSPADGTELWQIGIGGESAEDGVDQIESSPAIGEDGTIYVRTTDGWLIAFGEGCPEGVVETPPYTFRSVASVGAFTEGRRVDDFESFGIGADGLVNFQARIQGSPVSAVFMEQPGGGFQIVERGTILDGFEIDGVSLPQEDDGGKTYLPTIIAGKGGGVFIDGELAVDEGVDPVAVAPVVLSAFDSTFFDIDQAGFFLLRGQESEGDAESILRVRQPSTNVDTLLSVGLEFDSVNSFSIEKDPKQRRRGTSTGSFVAADHDRGVMVDGVMRVHNGDTVGGAVVYNCDRAQINESGAVHFRANHGPVAVSIFSTTDRLVGTGDVVDGFVIDSVERFDVNNDGVLAFTAGIVGGATGVFSQSVAIAVAQATTINGAAVQNVSVTDFDQNNAGEVAFVATIAGSARLFVATPTGSPGTPYTFREVLGVGETVSGVSITFIRSIELTDAGLVTANVEGSVDGGPQRPAYLIETAPLTFDRYVNGDVLGGLTINFGVADEFAPRIDHDGNVYLYAGTEEFGPTLFHNGAPLVQHIASGGNAPILLGSWPSDVKIFDITDGNHVLLYGVGPGDPSTGLIFIDALAETATQVFMDGAPVPGWTAETIDAGPNDERHVDNNNRTFVVHGNGRSAVLLDNQVHIRNGDTVDGFELLDFSSPQVDQGNPVFIAEFDGGNGLFTAATRVVGTGDVVGGHTVDTIIAHSMTNGVSAFTASVDDGRTAVFRGNALVAIESQSVIDGAVVLAIDAGVVRKNESAQVALVATTLGSPSTIFVASGADGALTFRPVASIGDVIETRTVLTLADVRLDDAGLVSFRSGDTPATTTLFRETSVGVFETVVDGDLIANLTVDFSLGNPFSSRVNGQGIEFLSVPVTPFGQIVFVDRQPFAQSVYAPPANAPLSIDQFASNSYVDHDESGRILVLNQTIFGNTELLSVDTVELSVSTVVRGNDVIDGFQLDVFWPAEVAGYGDDGVAVFRAFDANFGVAIMTQTEVIVLEGDEVVGHTLEEIDRPRRNAGGTIYYLGDGNVFSRDAEGGDRLERAVFDTVAGEPILRVGDFAVNDSGGIAYSSDLLGDRRGVFFDADAVAIPAVTHIDGQLVEVLPDAPVRVALNEAGQIAFLARVQGANDFTLYVATPALQFDGDANATVDVFDLDIFDSCFTGPNVPIGPECVAFDADGDCDCDMGDFAGFQLAVTLP